MNRGLRNFLLFDGVLLIVLGLFLCCPKANANIVEETFLPMETPSLDGWGYLAVTADPPVGFEGILCVELRRQDSGEKELLEVTSLAYYTGGIWLREGIYQLTDAYVLGSDHFSVLASANEIHISQKEDAKISLQVVADQSQEAQREQLVQTFEPKPVPTNVPENTDGMETERNGGRGEQSLQIISVAVPAILFVLAAGFVVGRYLYERFSEKGGRVR